MGTSALSSSPAALRNRGPIADVLAGALPAEGKVLLVAEGTGEHAQYLAARFPALDWLPTDTDPGALEIIAARQRAADLPNLEPPLALDVREPVWPVERAAAIVAVNLVHISPWRATAGLVAGAGRLLPTGGLLFLYGPYRRDGVPTAPSNEAFDASLRARSPDWGLRRLEDVAALAEACGLAHAGTIAMPANNLSLLFRRR